MNMQTPSSERLHIAFFGKRNAGKSSLVNAIAGQEVSIVSEVPGTTTDPVRKAIELPDLGPCLLIDTAGLDDAGKLGSLRVDASKKLLAEVDIAVVVCDATSNEYASEVLCARDLEASGKPFLVALNKCDALLSEELDAARKDVGKAFGVEPIEISATSGTGIDKLLKALLDKVPQDFGGRTILGGIVKEGDLVVLVMPQDREAPKGRLIMPQVQVLRELLDRHSTAVCCVLEDFMRTLESLSRRPNLVITDSSVFRQVARQCPAEVRLTSFSVLMAAYKGDIEYFIESAKAVDGLKPGSKILIAEACSHVPIAEDIGRVRIPAILHKRFGEDIDIQIASGRDFPEDLSSYSLIIHCGACVFGRSQMLSRIEAARAQHVPMTNYGIFIAHHLGILGRIAY
jgi:[FeFe] hydrogenase H-cluster maturation GTPase HydF